MNAGKRESALARKRHSGREMPNEMPASRRGINREALHADVVVGGGQSEWQIV